MHKTFNLLTVQNELGYTFKDPSYIKSAFMHRSYDAKGEENNVRLVFLGKHLLTFVLSDYITSRLPYTDENQLAYQTDCYLAALGTEKYLKAHGLTDFIMLGSVNDPMRGSPALAKEIFYAITAAIYRDGGMPSLKSFLMPMIRACGGDDHYSPSLQGQVLTGDDRDSDGGTHIKSERLRRPQKSGSIGFSKAETLSSATESKKAPKEKKEPLNATEKPEKKKKKQKDEPIPDIEQTEDTTTPVRTKTFIRDPFAPVRLSDDLRNFKPKRPSKYDPTVSMPEKHAEPEQTQKTTPKASESDDKNGKSLLQEFVQKNLRTANVLLSYKVTPIGKGRFSAEATLDGRVIGTASALSKKEAEKEAATAAYYALKDKNTAEHKWFFSLSSSDVTAPDTSSDYVSRINQHFQQKMHLSNAPISYERRKSSDRRQFIIVAVYDGKEVGVGKASSPKEAKQLAAKEACKKLGI